MTRTRTSELLRRLRESNRSTIEAYEKKPIWIREHHGAEQTVLAGGYGYRQILELVQNGADAVLEARDGRRRDTGGDRVHVFLRERHLYVANTGAPLSPAGLDALLGANISPKRGNQIGRFGLGFKSLLRFDSPIDVFTRIAGAIRFDPARCRAELRERFALDDVPALRLAWELPESVRGADPELKKLSWAETVVRVEIPSESALERMRQEIRQFPDEFLLFFQPDTTLTLDDGQGKCRKVRCTVEGPDRLLHVGRSVSRWRLAECEARIKDPAAIEDATGMHARERAPIAWAMPLDGRREEVGRFWAFFPTQTQSYVPGILNAPWKLNSDRTAIIAGAWNAALMVEASRLIVGALGGLATKEDPGRPLDAFPTRPERKDVIASPLVEATWGAIMKADVVPDGTSRLRCAKDLLRHPLDVSDVAEEWHSLAGVGVRQQLVHPTCLDGERAARLAALAERIQAEPVGANPKWLRRAEASNWLGVIASKDTAVAKGVLTLAKRLSKQCTQDEWSTCRKNAKIIPTNSGTLVPAPRALLAPVDTSVPGRETVARAIQDDPKLRKLLREVFDVGELDDDTWRCVLAEQLRTATSMEWLSNGPEFWESLRSAPNSVRSEFVESHRSSIRICRRDGKWTAADSALFPGGVVRETDSDHNRMVLVNAELHGRDTATLKSLGVKEVPQGWQDIPEPTASYTNMSALAPWMFGRVFIGARERMSKVHMDTWGAYWLVMPLGAPLLSELTARPRASLTEALLARLADKEFRPTVQFTHKGQRYAPVVVPHPLPWLLCKHGELEIGQSTVPLSAILARRSSPAVQRLPHSNLIVRLGDLLTDPELAVPTSSTALRLLWSAVISANATTEAIASDELGDLWSSASRDGVIPRELPSSDGPVQLSQILVTTQSALAARARASGRTAVTLDADTMQAWLDAGALDAEEQCKPEWQGMDGGSDRLTEVMPELERVMAEVALKRSPWRRVTGLTSGFGTGPAACVLWNGALLLDHAQLEALSRRERLRLVLTEIDAAGWLRVGPEEALDALIDEGVDERRRLVAQEPTLAARLLRAVGRHTDQLRHALGEGLGNQEFIVKCSPLELAAIVLNQHGLGVLAELKDSLTTEGLGPPARWGTIEAREFVASIGFPPEFAAARTGRREAEEYVTGPIVLPPLHDFQQEVLEGLQDLIDGGTSGRRVVVSLPTGAGKTRVTVEAAVRLVLAPDRDRRTVLWVAQTDELCEQAVEAFRQVWVNLGAEGGRRLRIVRLWGSNPSPAGQAEGEPMVVVASIQTIVNRLGDSHEWLDHPGLVVVDECHHGITKSYTGLLKRLGVNPRGRGVSAADELPLIGLSATPFRTDDAQSHWLATRFGNRWLPKDQAELRDRLIERRVLAQARYEVLKTEADLTREEAAALRGLDGADESGGEPSDLDLYLLLERLNQRLASDPHRNALLIDFIRKNSEHSILLFTNSVGHANEMAARLLLGGVPACAISGDTAPLARRRFVTDFQSGKVRVLCNHSVLATGFDAPKIDMVIIARQVFSPVRYMQMVGRGLRGELNGGTRDCRIVTVMDNLGRFAGRHPYHYCQHLYSGAASVRENSSSAEAS